MFSVDYDGRSNGAAPEGPRKVAGGKRVRERRPRFGDTRAVRPGGAPETATRTPHFLRPFGALNSKP